MAEKLTGEINISVNNDLLLEYGQLPEPVRKQWKHEARLSLARLCEGYNHLDYERYGLKRGEE
jgi:hypothetical protein